MVEVDDALDILGEEDDDDILDEDDDEIPDEDDELTDELDVLEKVYAADELDDTLELDDVIVVQVATLEELMELDATDEPDAPEELDIGDVEDESVVLEHSGMSHDDVVVVDVDDDRVPR